MKNLSRIIIVCVAASFLYTTFPAEKVAAQINAAAKTTATPKTTVKSTTKARKPSSEIDNSSTKTAVNSRLDSKPLANKVIVVATTTSRIRAQPKTSSAQLGQVKLGRLLPVMAKNADWYRVEYAAGKSGWISKTLIEDFETERRDEIYRRIAEKYTKEKPLDFASATEVFEFLQTAPAMVKDDNLKADLSLRRLRILNAALKAIPFGKGEQFPYKNFLRTNEKDVVYSDPSGEWLVRSEIFWDLREKYTALPAAEEIAWEAAQNPIAGECEGDINCALYVLRQMEGEYLNFYPNGKYSRKALETVAARLESMIANMKNKDAFTPLADVGARAEFNRFLIEFRRIISKTSALNKAKMLEQINRLDAGYK